MSPRGDPIDREDVLDAIEDALDAGDFEDAMTLCDLLLRADPADADALVLRGQVLAECGEFSAALEHYERARQLVPTWEDADLMCAAALTELGRLDEAAALADRALERQPEWADAHRARAIVAELSGDEVGAQRHYRRAHALDRSLQPPFRVTDELFEGLCLKSLSTFPPEITELFENLEVRMRDHPDPVEVRDQGPPLSMLVLGFFDGTPRSARTLESHGPDMPCYVFVFKKNHERICTSLAELEAQIDITLKHELGHFLGLEEDDMERMGLD